MKTSSSAIAERQRPCKEVKNVLCDRENVKRENVTVRQGGQFWQKVEDDIVQAGRLVVHTRKSGTAP